MIAAVLADAMEGGIRAVVYASDRRVFRFKAFTHPSRQVFIGAFVEIATTDARLVGDDNDRSVQLVGPEAGKFENSRNELELVRPMDVAMVNIDHAVAVKKKCTALHRCNLCARPKRCWPRCQYQYYSSTQAGGSLMSCARSFWSASN